MVLPGDLGRDSKYDLSGRPGGYRRIPETDREGTYLGGTVYFCPSCLTR
jgi:hypothetical protein